MVGEDEDKDYEQLDGFEDLSEENQEKIKKALEQGHVDDEDWKGVCNHLPFAGLNP
jgi:ubiquitin-conjugating enzyme E2 O